MHELFIADSILKSAYSALPQNIDIATVRRLNVDVGVLDAVVPDSLIFMFDAIKGEYGLPNVQLVVTPVEVVCLCRECHNEFTIDIPLFRCPQCGGTRVDVMQGRGVFLKEITTEDGA
jgi:hydrogenase nickel incorporation protein HypA/HybF